MRKEIYSSSVMHVIMVIPSKLPKEFSLYVNITWLFNSSIHHLIVQTDHNFSLTGSVSILR